MFRKNARVLSLMKEKSARGIQVWGYHCPLDFHCSGRPIRFGRSTQKHSINTEHNLIAKRVRWPDRARRLSKFTIPGRNEIFSSVLRRSPVKKKSRRGNKKRTLQNQIIVGNSWSRISSVLAQYERISVSIIPSRLSSLRPRYPGSVRGAITSRL